MNIKIKPRTYYKRYYHEDDYDIHYTGNKYVYIIAFKYKNHLLIKHTKKEVWGTIKNFQDFVNISAYYNKIEEISIEDVFLELL